MGIYRIDSGTVHMVVRADDARRAALWAVHRSLQQILPLYDDRQLSAADKQRRAAAEGCLVLDDMVRVAPADERSTGRSGRAVELPTAKLVEEWSRLMVALSRFADAEPREDEEALAAPA